MVKESSAGYVCTYYLHKLVWKGWIFAGDDVALALKISMRILVRRSSVSAFSKEHDQQLLNSSPECHPSCTIHGLYCYSIASSLSKAFDVTRTSEPPKATAWSVASTRAASRSMSTPRRWCWGDKPSTAMVTASRHQRACRRYPSVIWVTPSSVEAVLSWLCLTVATRPRTASPIAGVRKKICAILASK